MWIQGWLQDDVSPETICSFCFSREEVQSFHPVLQGSDMPQKIAAVSPEDQGQG